MHLGRLSFKFALLYRTAPWSRLTTMQIMAVFSTVFGATLNYDTILIYNFVEEDGEFKVLHCKHFSDPQQCSALITEALKAAANCEKVAA